MSDSAVFEQAYIQHTSSGLTQVRAGVCEELSWTEAAQIVSTYLKEERRRLGYFKQNYF